MCDLKLFGFTYFQFIRLNPVASHGLQHFNTILLVFSSIMSMQYIKLSYFFILECNCLGHSNVCRYDQSVADQKLSLDMNGEYKGGGYCLNCQVWKLCKTETRLFLQCQLCTHTILYIYHVNPFYATGLFLYPLKTSENQRFFDIFGGGGGGYRERPVTWN